MNKTEKKTSLNIQPRWHKTDVLILGSLIVIVSFLNYLWVIRETRPPHWDMARHLWTSLLYLQELHFKTFYHLWTNYYYYPPLRYWTTIPFYLLFGTSMTVAITSNVVFITVMVYSVYGIGRELWNRGAGLLAALFIMSMPMFTSQFKEYQLDAQLTAMVAWSLYSLIRAKEFSDRRWSLLFGLSFGLGMLTKWTFFHSMLIPLAYAVWKAFRSPAEERKTAIRNVRWSALIAAGISLLWYGNHPRMLFYDLSDWAFQGLPWYSPESIFWYFQRLETIQFFLFPFLLLAFGFALALLRKQNSNTYPLLSFLGCYVVFSLTAHKDVRYTMPMLVAASILGVYWISLIKGEKTRRLLEALVIAYCLFSFWGVSFGFKFMPKEIKLGPIIVFVQSGYSTASPPTNEQWHQEEIIKSLSLYPEKDRSLRSNCLNNMWFNNWGLMYYALKYKVALTFDDKNTMFLLEQSDQALRSHPGYIPIKDFTLPDQTFLRLSKRGNQIFDTPSKDRGLGNR